MEQYLHSEPDQTEEKSRETIHHCGSRVILTQRARPDRGEEQRDYSPLWEWSNTYTASPTRPRRRAERLFTIVGVEQYLHSEPDQTEEKSRETIHHCGSGAILTQRARPDRGEEQRDYSPLWEWSNTYTASPTRPRRRAERLFTIVGVEQYLHSEPDQTEEKSRETIHHCGSGVILTQRARPDRGEEQRDYSPLWEWSNTYTASPTRPRRRAERLFTIVGVEQYLHSEPDQTEEKSRETIHHCGSGVILTQRARPDRGEEQRDYSPLWEWSNTYTASPTRPRRRAERLFTIVGVE